MCFLIFKSVRFLNFEPHLKTQTEAEDFECFDKEKGESEMLKSSIVFCET